MILLSLARPWTACLLAFFLAASAATIDAGRYLDDVKALSADEMKGRGTGAPGLEKAAKYIAREFQKAGLQPLEGKTYFQEFTVSVNPHLGSDNRLEHYEPSGAKRRIRFKDEFIPFNFSSSGKASGQLVFAGYGITAKEYNYDDYAGLDVKDKIVVLLRHEPQEFESSSVFSGRVYTEHAQFFSKASNAKNHGAIAVLMVSDTVAHGSSDDVLEKFGNSVGPANAGIPFLHVKAEVVEHWFKLAGKDFRGIQQEIDKTLEPKSFGFPDGMHAEIQTDLRKDQRIVHNVAGYLPGLTDEYVVVGAHYDHLGLGEQFSLAPSMAGTPHPGADDNASGTAGVIELARWFGKQPKQKRGILFLAFAGEELGLLGSSYYVNHPKFLLEKCVAMINMDMIGRVRDGKVYVGGSGTGTGFGDLLKTVNARHGLKLETAEQGGYGSSDHTSFTTKQVPVLFFFSGLHGDYHKPSDTWDKIVPEESAKLLSLISDVTERLAAGEERPRFVRVEPSANPHAGAAGSGTSSAAGYGPYFGSIPDFAEPPSGVRFADVRTGSPAAKAGLKAGDILVEFDGKKIQNLYDFTYALRSKKPGEEIEVQVLRENQPIRVKVLLTERR